MDTVVNRLDIVRQASRRACRADRTAAAGLMIIWGLGPVMLVFLTVAALL